MAGTTLGTLSVDVLANIAEMVSDLGKAQSANAATAKQFQQDWMGAFDGVSDSFKTMAEVFGVGISVDWLNDIARDSLETAESISHLTESLGVSQQSLQTMSYAAGLVGGNLDTASQSFARLEKSAEQAAAGSAQQVEAFRAIGVSASQLTELLKNPDELIQTVTQHISQFGDGAGKTAVVMELFGRNAAQMIPYLNELGTNFDELQEKAAEFGVMLSASDQKLLTSTQETLNEIGQQVKGLGNEFTVALAPAITEVANDFSKLLGSESVRDVFADIGASAKLVADNIGLVGTAIEFLIAKQATTWFLGFAGAIATTVKEAAIYSSAMAEMTGTTILAEEAMTALSGAGSALFAVIGGIPGIIALTGLALYELATHEDEADQAAKLHMQTMELLNGVTGDNIQANIARMGVLDQEKQKLLDLAKADLAVAEAQAAAGSATSNFGEEGALAAAAIAGNEVQITKLRETIAGLEGDLANDKNTVNSASDAMRSFGAAVMGASQSFVAGDLSGNMAKFVTVSNQIHAAGDAAIASGANAALVYAAEDAAITKLGTSMDAADKMQINYNASVKASKDSIDESGAALESMQETVDKLTGAAGGPAQKAWDDYQAAIIKLNLAAEDYVIKGADVDKIIDLQNTGLAALAQTYGNTMDKIYDASDALGLIDTKFQEQLASIKGLSDAQEIEKQYLVDLKIAQDAWNKSVGEGVPMTDEYKQQIHDLAVSQVDQLEQTKASAQAMKDWENVATNAFDSTFQDLNKDLIEGGSFMKDLVNVAQQTVEAILMEFEKLAIIDPLMQQIFGSNVTGNLPTLANSNLGSLFNGNGGVGNLLSSWFGGGADTAGQSVGIFSDLGAGANGLSDTATAFTTDWGAAASAATDGIEAGMPDVGATLGTSASSSFLSTVTPFIGGAVAAFGEYNAAGGGIGGLAGAAAYGVGAYGAGVGIAAGLSGGLSAGLAAVPVIGWVGLGLMALNQLTGGDVFGTAYKPTGTTGQSITETGTGASVSDWYQEHKHGALFSGGSYKNVSETPTDDQTNAVDSAFNQIQTTITSAATALGVTAGDLIAGSWSQTTDKTGKVIANTSTVLGQTFSDTSTQFFERIAADSEEALLPVSDGLTTFFNQFQSNADNLIDAANMLVAAQVDVNNGMGLLGTADTSLADIGNEVQSLQQSGETLVQTYARLQTEQTDFALDLSNLGLNIGKTGADFVTFADTVSTMAGGIDNLNSELAALYADYIPANQQQSNTLSGLKKASDTALGAIGETVGESMSEFWNDFQTAMPTLSPADFQKWVTAGLALANYTSAVDQSAANLAAAQQKYADFEISDYGDAFVTAMAGVVEWEDQQIATANQLAQAAGKAGASQQDLANIMAQGTAQMGKAMADLVSGIDSDITTLGNLTTSWAGADLVITGNTGVNNAAAQQQQMQQVSTAYDLIEKLGDYAFGTGQDVDTVLSAFGISPGAIGKILGESSDAVEQQIQAAENEAASMTNLVAIGQEQTSILQDVLDVLQGKSPSIDLNTYRSGFNPIANRFQDPTTTPVTGSRGIPGSTSASVITAGDRHVADAIRENTQELRRLRTAGATNRNERPIGAY